MRASSEEHGDNPVQNKKNDWSAGLAPFYSLFLKAKYWFPFYGRAGQPLGWIHYKLLAIRVDLCVGFSCLCICLLYLCFPPAPVFDIKGFRLTCCFSPQKNPHQNLSSCTEFIMRPLSTSALFLTCFWVASLWSPRFRFKWVWPL